MVVCAQTSARVLVGRGAQRCPRPCRTRRTRRILDRHSSARRADKLAHSKCTHAHPGAAGHIPCAATASTPAARLPTPLTLGGVDSATTARPTGHVHTCQNDPTTCPSHHMSHLPCTGSHTGPRELRVGGVGSASLREGGSGVLTGGRDPKRGRIHALSQQPESPALRTSVCDAARDIDAHDDVVDLQTGKAVTKEVCARV